MLNPSLEPCVRLEQIMRDACTREESILALKAGDDFQTEENKCRNNNCPNVSQHSNFELILKIHVRHNQRKSPAAKLNIRSERKMHENLPWNKTSYPQVSLKKKTEKPSLFSMCRVPSYRAAVAYTHSLGWEPCKGSNLCEANSHRYRWRPIKHPGALVLKDEPRVSLGACV